MKHTTMTIIAVSTAAREGDGDFYATRSATARFATEALVDVACDAIEGLSTRERAKFASSFGANEIARARWFHATMSRDRAVEALCAWTSAIKLREWSDAYEKSVTAAKAELPAALDALGGAL